MNRPNYIVDVVTGSIRVVMTIHHLVQCYQVPAKVEGINQKIAIVQSIVQSR